VGSKPEINMFKKQLDTNSEINDREDAKSEFDSRDKPIDGN
jgi:hypothetical protein